MPVLYSSPAQLAWLHKLMQHPSVTLLGQVGQVLAALSAALLKLERVAGIASPQLPDWGW